MDMTSIKDLVKVIKKDVKYIVSETTQERYDVFTYGSYLFGENGLCILISVNTDKERDRLKDDAKFFRRVSSSLVLRDFPEEARSRVVVWVESQETVDRESKGDWYQHMR